MYYVKTANTSREDLLGLVLRAIVMVINNTNTVPVVPQQAPKGELGLFMSLVYGTVLHYTGCTVRDKGATTVRCACGASTVALYSILIFVAIITIQIVLYYDTVCVSRVRKTQYLAVACTVPLCGTRQNFGRGGVQVRHRARTVRCGCGPFWGKNHVWRPPKPVWAHEKLHVSGPRAKTAPEF